MISWLSVANWPESQNDNRLVSLAKWAVARAESAELGIFLYVTDFLLIQ